MCVDVLAPVDLVEGIHDFSGEREVCIPAAQKTPLLKDSVDIKHIASGDCAIVMDREY